MKAALFFRLNFCFLPFASCLLPSSLSGLLREDALVDVLRVADDDELQVADVCVGDAPNGEESRPKPPRRQNRPVAPDDDPDFLRNLKIDPPSDS